MSSQSESTEVSNAHDTEKLSDLKVPKVETLDTSIDRARSLVGDIVSLLSDRAQFYRMLVRCESILRENHMDFVTLKELLWEKEEELHRKNRTYVLGGLGRIGTEVASQTYDEYCDELSLRRFGSIESSHIIERLSATKDIGDILKLDREFTQLLARFRELALRRHSGGGEFPQELLVRWYFDKLDNKAKNFIRYRDSYKRMDFDAFRSDLLDWYENQGVLD